MTKAYAYATFRIVSDSLAPTEITKALKTQPSMAALKGEPGRLGKPIEVNQWLIDSTLGVDVDIEAHLRELVEFVASRADELNRLIHTSDARVEIFCTFGDPGLHSTVILDAELITKLALVPMELGLTWNMHEPEEQTNDHGPT